jgi:peptidyl-prolyl cis-trans isomerase SurA
MLKNWLSLMLLFALTAKTGAQTLFTYGKYSVDAKEFLRAYNKNNTTSPANKEKAIRDYLNLFISSRLKIRDAYDRRYDTLPQQKEELLNLREQILENYLRDPKGVERLVNQAFQRSQKDIRLAHIFIGFENTAGQTDSAAAKQKIEEAYRLLQKGESFSSVAKKFSDDPTAATNGGDIGYITTFTLPYELENIVYSTASNKFSAIHRSRSGFHIFKNLGERKAAGRIKAAQILLAFPPEIDEAGKKVLAARADSIYKSLVAGEDFAKLAREYSNDYVSAASGGMIQEFSVGQFEPLFESTVLELKENAISKPFETPHGIHIVKLIAKKPVPPASDKAYMDELHSRVQQNERIHSLEDALIEKVMRQVGFRQHPYRAAELWLYSDSVLDHRYPNYSFSISKETPLFSIGKTAITVNDWINYAQAFRFRQDGAGNKPHEQVMREMVRSRLMRYYREHLEDFNPEFRSQLQEFKDGNLFFEIMQKEVWGKMQSDTAALIALYQKNKSKYNWKQSADAIIFFCNDQATAKLLAERIKAEPQNWRSISESLAEKVVADSGRYEWAQIPDANKQKPRPTTLAAQVINKEDGSVSFAYVINVYTQPAPRTFEQARGLVINDYQEELERKWISELTKKYPVKVNEAVLKQIIR